MLTFEITLALEAVRDARKEWNKATAKFNADVEFLMTRLLNEAAAAKMGQTQVAESLGVTPTRLRKMMRDHGLNPKTGRNLLAKQAAETLEENAALLGVEPHQVDLTSPLAYLPIGSNLRKFLETNTVTGDDFDAIETGYGTIAEAVHDLHLRGAKLRYSCAMCGLESAA